MDILIADASPIVRRMIRNALGNAGVGGLIEAETGQRALQLLTGKGPGLVVRTPPAVVLVGAKLDDMSGNELAAKIRDLPGPHRIPMLLVTDRRSPEDVLEAVDNGFDHYILIPFADELLIEKVRKAVELVEQREAAENARRAQIQRIYQHRG